MKQMRSYFLATHASMILATCLLGWGSSLSTSHADIILTAGNLTYSQDFNTLTSDHRTTIPWVNDPVADGADGLTGWYANEDATGTAEIRGSTGGNSVSRNYSYATGSADPDRALGTLAAGGTGNIRFGVAFVNNTGSNLSGFNLSYGGEQWRVGQDNDAINQITVAYQIFSPGSGSITNSGYTALPSTTFNTPQLNSATGAALAINGNLPANRVAGLTAAQSVTWSDGDELWIRFFDSNNSGFDHGMAVDDFSFTAVPEPGTFALLALALGGLFAARRRMI